MPVIAVSWKATMDLHNSPKRKRKRHPAMVLHQQVRITSEDNRVQCRKTLPSQ